MKKLYSTLISLIVFAGMACSDIGKTGNPGVPLTDAESVAADLAALEVIYGSGDSAVNVTQNVTLPTTGSNGTTITWATTNSGAVTIGGAVTRPLYTGTDASVTLTATISKGSSNDTKTFDLTVKKNPQTDIEAVADDKAALAIIYGSGDSAVNVTQNVTLPTTGSSGTTITWTTTNSGAVTIGGTVTRPAFAAGDASVTLTATISKGSFNDTKTFNLTVKKNAQTDAEAVASDKAALAIIYGSGDSAGNVTQNVTLPTTGSSGTTITWATTNSGAVTIGGVVTRPDFAAGNASVTLTATITKNAANDTRPFNLTVIRNAASDAESVAADKAALAIIYGSGDSAGNVTQNVTLPTTGSSGTTITWATTNSGVVTTGGVVTRPAFAAGNASVTLTATITKNAANDTRPFNLTVIRNAQTDAEAVAYDKAALAITYGSGDSAGHVTQNVTLPLAGSSGTDITWISGTQGVIANNGTVTRPSNGSGNATVTLTATITKGLDSDTREFTLTVIESPPGNPVSTITPGWTIPGPPNATLSQSYTASVPAQSGCTYLWSIISGSATLIDTTTHIVTFTPTSAGSLQLQCIVTNSIAVSSTGTYSITVSAGAVLNANPDTITVGQGSILLATFTGTGIINPGGLSVTTDVGITVTPVVTTTYTLRVDGINVATVIVSVKVFMPKFVYVANNGNSISAFTLDTDTGGLTGIVGSPYAATVDQVVGDPNGKFLFASGHANGVYAYTINSTTGQLTVVTGSPFTTTGASTTYSVAVDPKNRFVYASVNNGTIYAFTLNATTGVLTPVGGSPFATGNNSRGEVMVHPSGKYLYAAVASDNTVDAFSIDQATGSLNRVSGAPFATGVTSPYGVAVDPTGAYFFTKGEVAPSLLAAYSVDISTGILSAVTDSPFGPLEGSDAYHGLCFHPTKSILYTAFYGSATADAGAYTLNLGTGALAPMAGSPYNLFSNHGSDNITVDRNGQFAFACNWGGSLIKRMRINGTTGLLTKLNGDSFDGTQDQDVTPVVSNPASIFVGGALQ